MDINFDNIQGRYLRFTRNIQLLLTLLFATVCSTSLAVCQYNWAACTIQAPYNNGYFLDIMFLPQNPMLGWACGRDGVIVRTTDAGATWRGTVAPLASQLESICFTSSRIGYCSGTAQGNAEGGIFKSVDGGATWRDITPTFTFNGSTIRAMIWGNHFFNDQIGLAVGGGCSDRNTIDGNQYFWKTIDGGSTWQLLFRGSENFSGMSHVLMYDPNGECFASSSGLLWQSTNGGRTWSVFSQTGARFWQENLSNRGNSFLVATAGDQCYGSGNSGDVRFSTNNGQSWRTQRVRAPIFGTFLLDPQRGWAAGMSNIALYTSDAGVTWTEYTCGLPSSGEWDDLWFINDSTGFICGTGIFRTVPSANPPRILSDKPLTFCQDETVTLSVDGNYQRYVWSTGETTPSIQPKTSGEYYVTVFTNNSACGARSSTIQIRINQPVQFSLESTSNRNHICFGDTVTLRAVGRLSSNTRYRWSTTDTTPTIRVGQSGVYGLVITDSNGCVTTQSITLTGGTDFKPSITASGTLNICSGDSVTLVAQDGFDFYRWNTGATTQRITVGEGGVYVVRAVDEYGCIGISDTIRVGVVENNLRIRGGIGRVLFSLGEARPLTTVCDSLWITNVGNVPIDISQAILNRNIEFSVPQSQLPLRILPNDSLALEVCFLPSILGEQRDTLVIGDFCRRFLFLQADGIPDTLFGTSACDVPLKAQTIRVNIPGLNIFPPYPQPSNSQVTIPLQNTNQKISFEPSLVSVTARTLLGVEIPISSWIEVLASNTSQKKNLLHIQLPPATSSQRVILSISYSGSVLHVPIVVIE